MTALVVTVVALALLAQSLFTLWLMVYTWDHPERMSATHGPRVFGRPRYSFTVLLPARHEANVIADTVRKVATARYPRHLVEIRVICHADDESTIATATTVAATEGLTNVHVDTFTGSPITKPRGLNEGLATSSNEVVCVFDAEDDVHPDIFNVVNTVMSEEHVGVVQAGVQLVNFRDRWFCIHNCLEYFFWYKSRLHFHARVGMIPLGGNTVFLRRDLVERVDGWDEQCLTEDADIGIRLSALGVPIRVVYDQRWVTREETPPTVRALVKQRTRWHQGFLQVLGKQDWRRQSRGRRALALLTLAQPLLDAVLFAALPLIVVGSFFIDLPVAVTLMAYTPLYAVVLSMVTTTVGGHMFAREFDLRLPLGMLFRVPLTYVPYQLLLGVAALRAVTRHFAGHTNWEKTPHLGAHRLAPAVTKLDGPGLVVTRHVDAPKGLSIPARLGGETAPASLRRVAPPTPLPGARQPTLSQREREL